MRRDPWCIPRPRCSRCSEGGTTVLIKHISEAGSFAVGARPYCSSAVRSVSHGARNRSSRVQVEKSLRPDFRTYQATDTELCRLAVLRHRFRPDDRQAGSNPSGTKLVVQTPTADY